MSLRIPITCFKNFHARRTPSNIYGSSLILSKYYISSPPKKINTSISENTKSINFSKYMQPLANHSVDEILSGLNSKSITANESVTILKALRMFKTFKNVKSETFISDLRFKTLCNIFEKNCSIMYPSLLVSGLRSLLEVGVSPESSYVKSAEESVMNNINLFSTFNLIGCLYFHYKFNHTDLQKKVVSLLTSELCKRIPEIATNADILMLVHFLHIFKDNDLKKIEHKSTELIGTLNSHEMCKIFITLAENSNRNVSILNALAFHLRPKVESLHIKEILDILYSFKKLNFFNLLLVTDLMIKVNKEIPSVTQPSVISGLLVTCGHLRLRNTGVLNACAKWILSNIETCRIKEFVSFILTVACLNYYTLEVQKTLQAILPLVSFEAVKTPDVWLDVVWSLAILNITDKDMLLKVLSSDFYKLLIESSGFQVATNKLKLMNLKAVLKNSHPECIFGCDLFIDPLEVPESSEIQNNRKHVLKVLSNFVPEDKYLCTSQNTDLGIFIDAEFIMDKNLKPLPLTEYGIFAKVTDTKPLPIGAQRIALLILFFKDFTLCSTSKTGFNDLAIRLLFSQGYTAVPISFDEFMRNNTEVKKTKYLFQKIQSIVQKVQENDYKFNIKLFH